MNPSRYLIIILLSGFFSWLAFALILLRLSPYVYPEYALVFFYLTLFVALSCSFAAIGFYFRVWVYHDEIFVRHIFISLRQGIFLSLIVIFCLFFQSFRVLTWWSGLLLVISAVLLEFYFSMRDAREE